MAVVALQLALVAADAAVVAAASNRDRCNGGCCCGLFHEPISVGYFLYVTAAIWRLAIAKAIATSNTNSNNKTLSLITKQIFSNRN